MALKTKQVEQANRLDRRRPASSSNRLDHAKTKQAEQANRLDRRLPEHVGQRAQAGQAEQAGQARQAKQAEQAEQARQAEQAQVVDNLKSAPRAAKFHPEK